MPLRQCSRRINEQPCPGQVEWIYVGSEESSSAAFCDVHGLDAQQSRLLQPGMWFHRHPESELPAPPTLSAAARIVEEHMEASRK